MSLFLDKAIFVCVVWAIRSPRRAQLLIVARLLQTWYQIVVSAMDAQEIMAFRFLTYHHIFNTVFHTILRLGDQIIDRSYTTLMINSITSHRAIFRRARHFDDVASRYAQQ